MRKGFTLLELIVVIIIIGILATLGLTQYSNMIERSRGAEARAIVGTIRQYAAAYRMEKGTLSGITSDQLTMGTRTDQIPSSCRTSHYFYYSYIVADPTITITATRCTLGGKTPDGPVANTLILTTNLNTGVDTWGGTGGY